MSSDLPQLSHSLLERLDIAMASRLAQTARGHELVGAAHRFQDRLYREDGSDAGWAAALLRLRGFSVHDEDAADVLCGNPGRLPPESQEHAMILGLNDVRQMIRERGSQGIPPDGWFVVELFKVMTRKVPRFRNNHLRNDHPWDGVLYVNYPDAEGLRPLLDTFDPAHRFRDFPAIFDRLHPVRQSHRLLWRMARIAPFPDLNMVMAWVAMEAYLLAKGYPTPTPEPCDRMLLTRLVGGPPPRRIVQFESRLLESVESALH